MANEETSSGGPLHIEVVTPLAAVLAERADEVVLPGINGEFGVLPGHLPLLAALDIGKMVIETGSGREEYVVEGGFAEVHGDRITVMTEGCQGADEIDVEHARLLMSEAEKELEELQIEGEKIEDEVLEKHRKDLKRARMRLLFAGEDVEE